MDVRVEPLRRLRVKELMPSNCCVEELLRVPWATRRSNQSNLKEINTEYSLEGLMLKLKLQSFSSDVKSQLIGKDSDGGKEGKFEGRERKG